MISIEGYLNTLSATPGETVVLHASSNCDRCRIAVFREGDSPVEVLAVDDVAVGEQPTADESWRVGAGWPATWELTIPDEWPSGVYRIELSVSQSRDAHAEHNGWWNETAVRHNLLLTVRAPHPSRRCGILLALSSATWMAYNPWGGKSLYAYNSTEGAQSPEVSLLRPGHGYFNTGFQLWERRFVAWCDREGIDLEFATSYDLETWPKGFDDYQLILSVGHDEYWSAPMRDNLERFIADGGNAAFFSGNSVCWQVRFEDEGRRMIGYKEFYKDDPKFLAGEHGLVTALWSHPLVARPENRLTGVGFPQGGYHLSHGAHMDGSGAYTVRRADHWIFDGTGLQDGDAFGGASTIVGYECDGCRYTEVDGRPVPTHEDGTPESFVILAQCPAHWTGVEAAVYQEAGVADEGRATMGIYQQGGTVFTSGTTDWSHGLTGKNPEVEQMTRNIIARLG